jgi:hypothetical protein
MFLKIRQPAYTPSCMITIIKTPLEPKMTTGNVRSSGAVPTQQQFLGLIKLAVVQRIIFQFINFLCAFPLDKVVINEYSIVVLWLLC